ncbi:MAG: polysaccharide lyase 6 family protein [Ignavibacteriales bacterium]|nr:polysaccharide lyase 6 family protein [Ignavibacteriales bacterium]
MKQSEKIRTYTVAACLLLLPFVVFAAQTTFEVKTAKQLLDALTVAEPGIRIILCDGEYDLGGEIFISAKGTAVSPIRIAAKHRGKAIIVGESHIILFAAEHLSIEGLNFESTNGPAVELRGCHYIQITRNIFHLKETQRGLWIYINGIAGDSVRLSHHNRIDHNIFEKKSMLGNFITIEGTMRFQPQVSQYDRIDHNLFADIGPRVENVLEAIRAGSAEYSLSSGFTVIEENLFERCDGDPEYISIKSSDDTIRNNTFRECLGSLSLRHGNRNTVEGNFVLGNGRTGTFLDSTGKTWTLGTGGVRFYGTGMRIINNYFEGLTGKRWDATFAITSGNAEYGDGQRLTKHFRVHDATIAGNILVNNAGNFEIGYDGGGFQGNWWHLSPTGLKIENNIVVGSQDTLIKIFASPVNSSWENNTVWPTGGAVVSRASIDGLHVMDPKLVKDGKVWYAPNRRPHSRPLERTDVGPESK